MKSRINKTCAHPIVALNPEKHKSKCNKCSFMLCVFKSTCNGVESGDHQHEDGGQVEVPSQAHLDKQGSRVQVSLAEQTKASLNADSNC